ncbi:MAG TPA: MarR family transcriptional regulator [Firmicutes bacterium]|nr:MarR family transcriptional regulator [Bacillota bacterium]
MKNHVLHGAVMAYMKIQNKVARDEFNKMNLTEGKPKILDFLLVNSGCSQKDISKNCHIEPATVTSILSSMEVEGLITRERNVKDKRVINVFLTENGKSTQEEVEKTFNRIDEWCFEGFSNEEKTQVIAYLNRMEANLKQRRQAQKEIMSKSNIDQGGVSCLN